ncbi:MAG: UDP-N-acetylmuramate dehydrogenase [Planctomycetota bacterium]
MNSIAGLEHIVRENEPLAPYTRLKIGGHAEYFAEPTNLGELTELVKRFSEMEKPVRLIGSGSNLLVPSQGVEGLVIHLSAPDFAKIEIKEDRLIAGAGTKLAHFVSTAVREGFSGPEQMAGLPGTIGGALRNNTGAHGVDIGSWVQSAQVMTRAGEVLKREKDTLSFSYRQSSLSELVILSAEFAFEKEPSETLTKRMQKTWIVRRAKQPGIDQFAAYMFEDLGGESASDLIDQAGLKGLQVGKVKVLDTDPNFFVAEPDATSQNVIEMIDKVKKEVSQKLDVELRTAIQIW